MEIKGDLNLRLKNFFGQKVNQNLCLALISLMAFWTVLYYFTNKAEAIADNLGMTSYSYLLESPQK